MKSIEVGETLDGKTKVGGLVTSSKGSALSMNYFEVTRMLANIAGEGDEVTVENLYAYKLDIIPAKGLNDSSTTHTNIALTYDGKNGSVYPVTRDDMKKTIEGIMKILIKLRSSSKYYGGPIIIAGGTDFVETKS